MPPNWQVVSEPGSTRSAVRVHSVSWLELACRFVGVLPGRYRACWRMRLCGHFTFTGGGLVVRHLPAACPAAVAALAAGAGDPLLPILQEDGVRGQLRANAAPEPQEAHTQLRLLTRAHLDEAFQQVGPRVRGPSRFILGASGMQTEEGMAAGCGGQARHGGCKATRHGVLPPHPPPCRRAQSGLSSGRRPLSCPTSLWFIQSSIRHKASGIDLGVGGTVAGVKVAASCAVPPDVNGTLTLLPTGCREHHRHAVRLGAAGAPLIIVHWGGGLFRPGKVAAANLACNHGCPGAVDAKRKQQGGGTPR